jgi:hypothetical protein
MIKLTLLIAFMFASLSGMACTGSFPQGMRIASVDIEVDRKIVRISLPDINSLECRESTYAGLWLKTLKLNDQQPKASYLMNGRVVSTNVLNRKSALVLMKTHQNELSTFSLEDFKTDTVYLINYDERSGLVSVDLFKRRIANSRRENLPFSSVVTY